MKMENKKTNKERTRVIYELIRKVGNGLARQYDELATGKRTEQKL